MHEVEIVKRGEVKITIFFSRKLTQTSYADKKRKKSV